MSYIGNTPTQQNFVAGADQFSGNGSTVAFTLSRSVNTVFDIFVTVSNVPQDPFTAYTVAGNTLTFDSAPPSGTNNIDVVYRATNVQTFVPSPGVSQQFAIGTAAAPGITFIGDTNTGIYSPGADTVGLTAGGTLVGSVGLGTTLALQGATSQAGTGITFPATQSASSNANTLDDYEEGTWTPSVTSLGGTITTVGAVSGTYTKIGRTVVATYEVAITTAGTAASAIQIAGLPFTCATRAVGCGREVNLTGYITSGILAASSSTISVRYYDASYPGASGSQNTGTITYQV